MFNYKILSFELLKIYVKYFILTSFIIICFLCFSSVFDLIQKFKDYSIGSIPYIKLILFRVPYLLNETVALVSLISMLFFIKRLTKYNELLIILNNGISVWKIVISVALTNFAFGLIFLFIINPISSFSLNKISRLESKITNRSLNNIVLLNNSFLFFEEGREHNKIIKAKSINLSSRELNSIIILLIDSNNNFLQRIDAKTAKFGNGHLELQNAQITENDKVDNYKNLNIETALSSEYFASKLTKPETIPIWELPKIIDRFYKAGLPVNNYKIYYYKQIFKPLLMLAMAIFGGCFIIINQKSALQTGAFIFTLILGILLNLTFEVITKILTLNGLSPAISTILPIILIILIGNFVILHFNEG